MWRAARATALTLAGLLSACATTQSPIPPDSPTPPVAEAEPAPTIVSPAVPAEVTDPVTPDVAPLPAPTTPPSDPLPPVIVDVPDVGLGAAVEPIAPEPVLEQPEPFAALEGWADADLEPALAAFRRSCIRLLKRPGRRALSNTRTELGLHSDWALVCRVADKADHARPFFESLFVPLATSGETGLLTGYYESELEVRAAPDAVYSEPILSVPDSDAVRKLPRKDITADSAPVIAYGRPVDVFFLQVQGSGRLHFDDGRVIRAGYAANNGKAYKSIGRVLIDRGELTREETSKARIEQWMSDAGPVAARELMNQNPRYIFFSERDIPDGEGPTGAMQVPLTAMGSIAVDPKQTPYGIPVWLDTRLPKSGRDHRGAKTGLLTVTQDTGSAIRGPLRADLYFGAGRDAGALAGVMKHPARWTVLVPRTLMERRTTRAGRPVS